MGIWLNPIYALAFCCAAQLLQYQVRPIILMLTVIVTTSVRQNERLALAIIAFELLATNPNAYIGLERRYYMKYFFTKDLYHTLCDHIFALALVNSEKGRLTQLV